MAGVDGPAHVLRMEERWRVDGHQVDVGPAQGPDRGHVPRRHHLDHIAAGSPEGPGDHPRAETGPDDADAQGSTAAGTGHPGGAGTSRRYQSRHGVLCRCQTSGPLA